MFLDRVTNIHFYAREFVNALFEKLLVPRLCCLICWVHVRRSSRSIYGISSPVIDRWPTRANNAHFCKLATVFSSLFLTWTFPYTLSEYVRALMAPRAIFRHRFCRARVPLNSDLLSNSAQPSGCYGGCIFFDEESSFDVAQTSPDPTINQIQLMQDFTFKEFTRRRQRSF